ncbi:MAG TPA: oligosaccharide flippase family protein, partial [Anaeromyxobacteraceae bacterium]|nr:oligosaccharide flippase family protein [Anaeromyxobacteraceae bacterium]
MARHPWCERCLQWARLATGRDRSFHGNVISSAFVNALGLLVGIATASLLARSLGSRGRGEFAAINGWATFIGGLAAFGLPTAAIYYAARSPRRARSVSLTAAVVSLPVLAIVVALGWCLVPWILRQHGEPIIRASRMYVALYAITNIALYVPFGGLQAVGAFGAWNLARMTQPVAWLGLLALMVASGHHDAAGLGIGQAITFVAVAPIAILLFHRASSGPYRLLRSHTAPMLRYGAESVLANVSLTANRRFDQMVMAALIDPRILGLYAAAVNLTALLSAATSPVANVLMPRTAALLSPQAKR